MNADWETTLRVQSTGSDVFRRDSQDIMDEYKVVMRKNEIED